MGLEVNLWALVGWLRHGTDERQMIWRILFGVSCSNFSHCEMQFAGVGNHFLTEKSNFSHVTNLPKRRLPERKCVPVPFCPSLHHSRLYGCCSWKLQQKKDPPKHEETSTHNCLKLPSFLLTNRQLGSVWFIPSLHTGFKWADSSRIFKVFHHDLSLQDLEYFVCLTVSPVQTFAINIRMENSFLWNSQA